MKTLSPRSEIAEKDKWNVADFYPNWEAWDLEFENAQGEKGLVKWPEIKKLEGTLKEGPKAIKKALETLLDHQRKLVKLYTYAHLRHDEDIAQNEHKIRFGKALLLLQQFEQSVSWVEPELLCFEDASFQKIIQDETLKEFKFYLEKIYRLKKHTLPKEQESLLALASQALQTSHKAFSALSDADFIFGTISDQEGHLHELTQGSYGSFLQSKDRTLRKQAFERIHSTYEAHENTLTELLQGQIQAHFFEAKARNYSSCLEAALYPKNIHPNVYFSLIEAVNDELPTLHKYIDLRKKQLNVDTLHGYDLYVPLTETPPISMSWKEAVDAVIESSRPLGEDYQNSLKKGLTESKWVDVYENKNKRSGAYSSGCYDSLPYILMNYKGLLRDVFTLAHEAGHSMHSLLSKKHQPYHYSQYPIYVAEVASTFNEELLNCYLMNKAKTSEQKIFLINQKIEDIRTTLFRQTLFAEFELWIHQQIEQGTPLTPALLSETFGQLNKKYYGPSLYVDPKGSIEWARIPHFYYNFYVYQYATGLSASLSLAETVLSGGRKEQEAYLNFLKGGFSQYPIDLLKSAGVNMETPAPVKQAISKFSHLVSALEKELTPSFSF